MVRQAHHERKNLMWCILGLIDYISEEVAKGMAISAIKNPMLKQPIKTMAKELSKFVPFLGQMVAPTLSVAMLESAGWILAKELDQKFSKR